MGAFHIVVPPAFGRDNRHWLAGKLNPMFFPGISPEFVAIVGFVVEAAYTRPGLCGITVDEGYVVAALSDAEDSALCSYEFLRRNWIGLLDAAGLTWEERMEAECRFAERIGRPDIAEM